MTIPATLALNHITRNFTQGGETLHVLRDVNLSIEPGEVVALVGPSGSGKTTMLQISGLLDSPTSGEVLLGGKSCGQMNDHRRTRLRLKYLGFIYQFHHLLPEFSALENIMIPQMIAGVSKTKATIKAQELLERLGLTPRAQHRPAELSGGEQQRVAIARALANDPAFVLADEPTGNLDPHTADQVFSLFMELAKERKLAALIATHNLDLAKRMDRVVRMEEGTVK